MLCVPSVLALISALVPFPIPATLRASGLSVTHSPPLPLSADLVGIEPLPLSALLQDRVAVGRVPAAVVGEVARSVAFAPLTHHHAVAGGAVAVRAAWSPTTPRAECGWPARSDRSFASVAVSQPPLVVRVAETPSVTLVVTAVKRTSPRHRHDYRLAERVKRRLGCHRRHAVLAASGGSPTVRCSRHDTSPAWRAHHPQ